MQRMEGHRRLIVQGLFHHAWLTVTADKFPCHRSMKAGLIVRAQTGCLFERDNLCHNVVHTRPSMRRLRHRRRELFRSGGIAEAFWMSLGLPWCALYGVHEAYEDATVYGEAVRTQGRCRC
jgi:hypothetical protein